MTMIQLIACIGMIAGLFMALGISPAEMSDSIFSRLTAAPGSIRADINETTKRKKAGFFRREITEAQAVLENLPLLQSLGFDVSEFSDWQLVLRQVPADLSPDDACAALEAFAEDLLTGKRPSESDLRDNLLHTMACKAAIKAGWHTEPKEREALGREGLSRDDIKYCPHGRPVCIELTRKELERQFKRT